MESLKDVTKVFTVSQSPKNNAPAAGNSPADTPADPSTSTDQDDTVMEEPPVDNEKDSAVMDTACLNSVSVENQAVHLLEKINNSCPEIAVAAQSLIEGLLQRVQSLENKLKEHEQPSTFAAAINSSIGKRNMNDELRLKLSEAKDKPAKT